MSLTLLLWVGLYFLLAVMAWRRPVWGVSLYFLSYFGDPHSWWWGQSVSSFPWNFYGALNAIAAALAQYRGVLPGGKANPQILHVLAILIAINATVVHFLFARSIAISEPNYVLLVKFVVLYGLIVLAVRDPADVRVVLVTLMAAAAHLGFEVTFNGRGSGGRLEGVGPPTAQEANGLASLMTTILPLCGVLFLILKGWRKVLVFCGVGLAVNVILLCNSRGGFLASLASAVVFYLVSPAQVRRIVLKLLLIGAVGTLFLLRDEKITARFSTTFASEEERDSSAAGRLIFWRAGLTVIQDYPLGTGGDGFKKVHAKNYLDLDLIADTGNRAVHNGYINEACEWGIQGLILRLLFVGGAVVMTRATQKQCVRESDREGTLIGASILSSFAAFLLGSVFGDRLDNEWGYWLVAIAACYCNVHGRGASGEPWNGSLLDRRTHYPLHEAVPRYDVVARVSR